MTVNEIRTKYLEFFKSKNHVVIPSTTVVPENDPTTLFTGSGMQPMISYFLGESHPLGSRVTDSQKCFRAEDIDEVGDNRHTTFFEMLGNWSFGDYWKEDQLSWIFTFLIEEVGLDPNKLYVTVFSGDKKNNIPPDDEAVNIWKQLFQSQSITAKAIRLETEKNGSKKGMQGGRIFHYDASKNWWSRAGVPSNMPAGEPGGPDSEIFYEFTEIPHNPEFGTHCHPNCDCGRFLEIGNSVFMTYQKQSDGSFTVLPKKNIDFGGGLERITAASKDNPDVFSTDVFRSIIDLLEKSSQSSYQNSKYSMRTIADHLRAAVHMVSDGVIPSNKMQGYVLRRLIRKSLFELDTIGAESQIIEKIIKININNYRAEYPEISKNQDHIAVTINREADKFSKTLKKGLKQFEKMLANNQILTGAIAFKLFETFGYPFELTIQTAKERQLSVTKDIEEVFQKEKQKHAELSRTSSKGLFKGGLAGTSQVITRYHTATHLLHQALRDVLGKDVSQMGSNITDQRLRFDFKHSQKLTPAEISKTEKIVNQKIDQDLPVHKSVEIKEEALNSGALAFFREKYTDKVSVYTIGRNPKTNWYSKELCGGPHVKRTGELSKIKITKEKSTGASTRRVYVEFIE